MTRPFLGPNRSAARDTLIILASAVTVGVLCGVVWWLLVEPATFTKVARGGVMNDLELGKQFDVDGWYAVIALVAGLLSGGLLTWWRSRDFVLTTLLLAIGGAVAAASMAVTGLLLGPGDPDVALAAAELEDEVAVQLRVTVLAAYLVWPIAMLAGALMVLWSAQGGRERGG